MSRSLIRKQVVSYCIALGCCLCVLSCGDCVETPSLSSITPSSATAGGASIELTVNGNHFERNSTVLWNGQARTTTFVNGHQLKGMITAQDLAENGVVQVQVFSPPQSQPVTFGSNPVTVNPLTNNPNATAHNDCVGGTSGGANFTVIQP